MCARLRGSARGSVATGLVRARREGRLSRRELIERAASAGLAAPVIGVLLHASGDAAWGAPVVRPPAIGRLMQETQPLAGPTLADQEPREGGNLAIGLVGAPGTIVPYAIDPAINPLTEIQPAFLEGLIALDARQQLQPALAESWEIGDDGVTYTFTLRQEVLFHNDEPLTSADVVATWQAITGDDLPVWTRRGWERIERIETPDERTVVMTTQDVYAPFLSYLAAGATANSVICSAAQLEAAGGFAAVFAGNPVGTGPFRVTAVQPESVELERFEGYWGTPARLDTLSARFSADYETQRASLEAGLVDLVSRTGSLANPRVDDVNVIPGVTILSHPAMTWGHLALKQIGLLRETRVRQALVYATPIDGLIAEVLDGHAVRAVADQAPGSWAYDGEITARGYDPERAVELLERVNVVPGEDGVMQRDGERLAIQLWAESGDEQARKAIELIANRWQRIGIAATTHFDEAARLWGPTGYQFTDRMTAGYGRWQNLNDPDNMLYWHSSQIPTSPTGAGGNVPAFFYEYPFQEEIDALTAAAATELDQERRVELYAEIQELLRDEAPVIFLFWDLRYAAAREEVGGFWPSAFTQLCWNAGEWWLARD